MDVLYHFSGGVFFFSLKLEMKNYNFTEQASKAERSRLRGWPLVCLSQSCRPIPINCLRQKRAFQKNF